MKKIKHLPWIIYGIAFGWISFGNLVTILVPGSPIFIYYTILRAMKSPEGYLYSAAILSAFLPIASLWTILSLIKDKVPIFTFLFQWLFFIRILADILGHGYEWQIIQSIGRENMMTIPIMIFLYTVLIIPSYKAHFNYAFRSHPIK